VYAQGVTEHAIFTDEEAARAWLVEEDKQAGLGQLALLSGDNLPGGGVVRTRSRLPETGTPQLHKALPFTDKRAILAAHRDDGPDGACAEPGSPEENVLRKDRSIQSHT